MTPLATHPDLVDAVHSLWHPIAEGWRSRWHPRRLTTAALGCLIAGGVMLRVQGVGYPATFTFDEELFVRNVHHYLVGLPDANDHPPLGKLMMAVGLLLFGYNSVGWRFISLCFGIQTIAIAYWLAWELFEDRRAGWMAAAFVAADGFFVAYSRVGLLDGALCCLILWSLLWAATARSWQSVLGTSILIGAAASIKWSGFLVAIPATLAVVTLGRAPRLSSVCLLAAPLVHLVIWMLGLYLTDQPSDPASVWEVMTRLWRHHLELGEKTNPLASPWYSWIALYHPIVVKLSVSGTMSRYASSLGNPLLWCLASLWVVGLPLGAGLAALRPRWRKVALGILSPSRLRVMLLLALAWLALLSPWTVARGKYTFMYHYLPSYGFALVLLAGSAAMLERRRPGLVLGLVALTLAISVYLAPIWGEWPLSELAANRRLIFGSWRP